MDALTKKVLLRSAELVERGWCQGALGFHREPPLWNGEYFVSGIVHPAGLGRAERVCLDGALLLATHEILGVELDQVSQNDAYRTAGHALRREVARTPDGWDLVDWSDLGVTSYVNWNDMAGRTADEVAAICRKAAE